MDNFAATLLEDLHRYLVNRGAVDERMPECPDVEDKWVAVAEAYLPDGAREFASYPIASLGWMMFIGMAIAKYWDTDWEKHGKIDDLYTPMRDKRGFDNLDEYILDEVLDLHGDDAEAMQTLHGTSLRMRSSYRACKYHRRGEALCMNQHGLQIVQ